MQRFLFLHSLIDAADNLPWYFLGLWSLLSFLPRLWDFAGLAWDFARVFGRPRRLAVRPVA